jgi:hypothetical protein
VGQVGEPFPSKNAFLVQALTYAQCR